MSNIEYDDEITVWALDEQGAVDFFGFDRNRVTVRVLKDKPETEREKEKYRPSSKLFGIKIKEKE